VFQRRQSNREFIRELLETEREFRREVALRMERSERRIIAEIVDSRRESSAAFSEVSETLTEIKNELVEQRSELLEQRTELIEHRAERRAILEALFRILDRLDRPGPGDAPA
jgi:hypothetical protein